MRHFILLIALSAAISVCAEPIEILSPERCGQFINDNKQARTSSSSQQIHTLESMREPAISHADRPPQGKNKTVTVLVWNTYKFKKQGASDLIIKNHADFVLLQESLAASHENLAEILNMNAQFSPGYRSARGQSGVATLSRYTPLVSCSWKHYEPWLKSPKATLVTLYSISGVRLLTINLHAINFTLSAESWRNQLLSLEPVLASYTGSLILAGDFNTWSNERLEWLKQFAFEQGLFTVTPTPDRRTTVFGNNLDHLFVRGVKVDKSSTIITESSDHNAVLATLILSDSNSL